MSRRAGTGHKPRRPCRGFTLFELVVLIVVIGLVAIVVVPQGALGGNTRLGTAANVVAADVEYCQSACIASPATALAMTLSVPQNTYSIGSAKPPTTPIKFPGDSSQAYVNDFATGRDAPLAGVHIVSVNGLSAFRLTFDAYGRPLACDGTGITYSVGDVTILLSDGGTTLKVFVDSSTGDVSIK